ncbi:hypothetical protein [Amphibacillus cookii]|nr:hypothetical protein [Amphibacillus cookii]MBM7541143.1 hypothetical protein [Amphibacillus cookii]
MLDQNTDRSGWAMVALVILGVALVIIDRATNNIGNLVIEQIIQLFNGV